MANGWGRAATSVGQMLMQHALHQQQRQDREAERKDISDLRREQARTSRLGTMLAPGDTFLPYSPGMAPPPDTAQPLNVMGESGFRLPAPSKPAPLPPTIETSSGIFARGQGGLEPVIDPVTQKPAMPFRAPTQGDTGQYNRQFLQVEGPEGPQYMLGDPRTGAVQPVTGPGGEPIKPKAPTQRRLPQTVLSTIASNQTQIGRIDEALQLLGQRPEGVGLKGFLPEFMLQRADPEGVPLRAILGDLGSLVIHDRSGTATSVGEMERLKPFVTSSKDTPEAARAKLLGLRDAIMDETAQFEAAMQQYYGIGGESATPAAPPASAALASWQARASELKAQGMAPDDVIATLRSEGLLR